jgi:hypothetical protein
MKNPARETGNPSGQWLLGNGWMDGWMASSGATTVDRELTSLAVALEPRIDPHLPDPVKKQATLDWLRRNSGWLLPVDNVDSDDVRTWPILEPLCPHLTALIAHADAAGIAEPTSRLLNVMGELFRARALFIQAETMTRRTLAIAEQSYGTEHPNVAIRLNNLAQLLQATNRLAEAEPLMRRALEIFRASLGDEHPNTLGVAKNHDLLRVEMEQR